MSIAINRRFVAHAFGHRNCHGHRCAAAARGPMRRIDGYERCVCGHQIMVERELPDLLWNAAARSADYLILQVSDLLARPNNRQPGMSRVPLAADARLDPFASGVA